MALMFCLLGCGKSGPVKHAVSGSVSWMGAPIQKGYIHFVPADGSGVPDALEIENGQYQGEVTPGEKKVEIRATREKTDLSPEDLKLKETMGMAPRESFIPPEYNDKTKLTATITSGTGQLDFALPQ
ncbi:MAG: hypothetical protein AB7K24_00315 [Gemmataceae bacterium]